eukprot:3133539-Alexandrium_andersonii.AAC.1
MAPLGPESSTATFFETQVASGSNPAHTSARPRDAYTKLTLLDEQGSTCTKFPNCTTHQAAIRHEGRNEERGEM